MSDIRKFAKPSGSEKGTVPPTSVAPDTKGPEDKQKVTQASDSPISGLMDTEPQGDQVIEGYLEYLKEHDIGKSDIFQVLDSIITAGEVFWNFDLLGKIPVVFKMRPAWVNEKMMDRLDKDPPQTQTRFFDLVSLYNLAGSLVQYKDYKMELQTEEDLETNIAYISSLPFVIQNRMVKQMAIFDRVIAVATSDWAVENFTEPLSDV